MAITIWSGLTLGAVYASVSLGFTLSLRPSGIFNFPQGAMVVRGTYLVYVLLGSADFALLPALALNCLIGCGLGIACELLTVRPLRIGGRASQSSSNEE